MNSPIELLETAVKRYEESRKIFTPGSLDYAHATMYMGDALQKLANLGINEKNYLETAVKLYDEAREIFSPTSSDYASVSMNQGNALKKLSDFGISDSPTYVSNNDTVNAKVSSTTKINSVSSPIKFDFEGDRTIQFYSKVERKLDVLSTKMDQIREDISKTNVVLSKISVDCSSIKFRIEKGFEGTETELKKINMRIDSVQCNFGRLMQISNSISDKEAECVRKFVLEFSELMKSGEYGIINVFLEKMIQHEISFKETIENSCLPEKDKVNAKSKLSRFKNIPKIVKKKAKSFSINVTKDVIVTLTADEIVKLLIPLLSTAIIGVPIPSQVVGMLLTSIRNV